MTDLMLIREQYQRMADAELVALAQKPADLRSDVITILQQELINRGLTQEAVNITDRLIASTQKQGLSNLSIQQLKQLVDERLQAGESIESIRLDLIDHGIDPLEILTGYQNFKEERFDYEEAFDYITHWKEQGREEEQINEQLAERYAINATETEFVKARRKKSGKRTFIVGIIISVLLLFVILLGIGLGYLPFITILLLITSIIAIFKGYERMQ